MVLAAVATDVGAPVGAVSIINGSFELGAYPGASFSTLAAGSQAITGWKVGGAGVDYIGDYWQASEGNRSVDLSALSSGSISQDIATEIGKTYTVMFDMSGIPDAGVGTEFAVSSISGSLPVLQSYTVAAANSHANMNWQPYSYKFTAFGTTSTLTVASLEYNSYGPALDNVSILESTGSGSTVPEPASWALMLVGFGMIGAATRRRTAMTTVAA